MKKIGIVYRNRKNPKAIVWLGDIVKNVFGDYVTIDNYYLDEVAPGEVFEEDALIVNGKRLLPKLRNHTSSLKNVVVMTRSIRKEFLDSIMKIPADTDVLIVNDTLKSAEEMQLMFYDLGISHFNLIPYDREKEKTGIYRGIHYVITPNEPQAVPPYIENVINTGYREIGFDTMVQIMDLLKLNNEKVTYNLIKYISGIIEPMQGYRASYFSSYLKERMLNEYVYDSEAAIFVADAEGRAVYSNRRAEEMFGLKSGEAIAGSAFSVPPELLELLENEKEIFKKLITIDDVNYMMDKVNITAGEQYMGYFVTLQDEKVLKDIEISFNKNLREKGLYAKHTFNDIWHVSDSMERNIEKAKKAAATEYTILIGGESGTGKELFAQAIHNYSNRKNMPFIGVNCAAISESLLESELFGYEEGAFTGARKKGKLGYFEQANKGTIFLDEIGDISPRLQLGLLRVLQEKQIMKIGSDRVVDVDVRIIAATNKNLLDAVERGDFRRDLYYRLNAIAITLPPLRRRREDIPLIFQKFMGKDYDKLSDKEKDAVLHYDWPGNIRELENCALYYKTLGELPGQLAVSTDDKDLTKGLDEADIQTSILRLIDEKNEIGHGLGRTALLQLLLQSDIRVSDAALRKVLSEMEKNGYVKIGKGRQGTSITLKGKEFLAGSCSEYGKNKMQNGIQWD